MKKVVLFAIIAMFLMVPLSFAKTAITEKDLADVTAQEGVTINFSCFTLGAIKIDVQAWGDSDGCSACASGVYTNAGWVGASITLASNFVTLGGNMTIDVGSSGTKTALVIGLPSLTLGGDMTQIVKLGTAAGNMATSTQVLGTSYMSGLSMSPSGYLIITAH
jgi:hypothetical protein